jgi:hypothetical protein
VPPEGTPTRSYFDAMFTSRERASLPGLIEMSSLVLLRGVLSRSDRLTIISPHQVVHERETGVLAPLSVELEGSDRRIGLTMRRNWRPTPAQRLLLSHVRSLAEALGGWSKAPPYSEIE